MRTYDIINAGPKNRFTANGRVVSNSGQIFQPQNLPKIYLKDIDLARQLLLQGDADEIDFLFGSVSNVLRELIRTSLVAPEGKRLIVVDFNQIEARVGAWLAREAWMVKLFKEDGKLYETTASMMFRLPIEQVTKEIRQKGKIAALLCQYGGSVGAMERMGALEMGLTAEELPEIVAAWRSTNPNTVKFWWDAGAAALKAVKNKTREEVNGIIFHVAGNILRVRLPSGRSLSYLNPQIVDGKYGDQLCYSGVDQLTKRWGEVLTYGPKLYENFCQGIARDCLVEAMLRCEAADLKVVLHVHDEIIIEGQEGDLPRLLDIMSQPIAWAPGLKLKAEGEELKFYKK